MPDFAKQRRELEDCGDLYARIVNDRQALSDRLQREINDEKLRIAVEKVDEKGTRIEAIMSRLPFLANTDPERADLQGELDGLKLSV